MIRWQPICLIGWTLGLTGVPTSVLGQELEFLRTYGGPGIDVGNSVVPMPDDGYVVLGYTDGPAGSQRDAWLLRLNESGDTVWTRRYGGEMEEHGWDLALTPDSTLVIVGFKQTPAGDNDVWILHVDGRGAVIWERTFGGPRDDRAWAISLLENGDFLVLGETESLGAGAEDIYLIRMNMHGDTLWTRNAGGAGTDRAFAMTPFEDGALFTGLSGTHGNDLDILVGTVSGNGVIRLNVLASSPGDEVGHGVSRLQNDGFLVTGYGVSSSSGSNDVMFLVLDEQAEEIDQFAIQGLEDERAMMTAVSANGLLGTVGYTQRRGDWGITMMQGTLDEPASDHWFHEMDGDGRGVMAIPTTDGGWIVTGTLEMGSDPGQLVVMKVVF